MKGRAIIEILKKFNELSWKKAIQDRRSIMNHLSNTFKMQILLKLLQLFYEQTFSDIFI